MTVIPFSGLQFVLFLLLVKSLLREGREGEGRGRRGAESEMEGGRVQEARSTLAEEKGVGLDCVTVCAGVLS